MMTVTVGILVLVAFVFAISLGAVAGAADSAMRMSMTNDFRVRLDWVCETLPDVSIATRDWVGSHLASFLRAWDAEEWDEAHRILCLCEQRLYDELRFLLTEGE